jgi:glycerol kinase
MLLMALDQGTTSTRCMVFDQAGRVHARAQREHRQLYPQAGWVEHDPLEIWANTEAVISEALGQGVEVKQIAALGLTNQRETTLVWERATGRPIYNAIVWQDTRTAEACAHLAKLGGQDRFRAQTGLPLATYFSGPKLQWLLDQVEGARPRAAAGDLLFGTIDSWLIWNLTGGAPGGLHLTDVTNASRTQLMNIHTLAWDDELLRVQAVPRVVLPEIRASSEVYGTVAASVAGGALAGVPIGGALGDQQAALFGQTCFAPGEAKNTYGTGCFMLLNTGPRPVASAHGLLTTLGYQRAGEPPVYALEGSIAIAGALVQWLRDNLGLIAHAGEIEPLARSVPDNGGVYFVPAFSGLYAPYWKDNARGVIAGLTRFVNKGHIARAALEATAFQTRAVLEAMHQDAGPGVNLTTLKVDGGMVFNDTLMQFQADVLGVPVIRPTVAETTALGAAYAAGLAVGAWAQVDDLRANWGEDRRWEPSMAEVERERLYAGWQKAVTRTYDWVD